MAESALETTTPLKTTPLTALHQRLGGKLVPFAGYSMPVQFAGVMGEHTHTRSQTGLFDVSHMGQATLTAAGGGDPAEALESLVPGAIQSLKPGHTRYTLLLNDKGGIRDDLMVTRLDAGTLYLVVNGACKDADFAHIAGALAGRASLTRLDDRALIALQGPASEQVLAGEIPGVEALGFLQVGGFQWGGRDLIVSRSGYTGEDGYEISVPAEVAESFAETLLTDAAVEPIGLGARDSLRLEAGLCLYGNDLDETTTPVEADLVWTIPKRRREAGGFPGFDTVARQLREGTSRLRVGLRPEGRAIAREGAEILSGEGAPIGVVTSGSFGPTVGGPVAMGYVEPGYAAEGSAVQVKVRNKLHPARVTATPFVPHRYVRK